MSYSKQQLDTILDIQADFDMAVSEKKWDEARAMVQQMGDLGYETEALFLHQALNRAQEPKKSVLEIMMEATDKTIRA